VEIGFRVADYDPAHALVVDPVVEAVLTKGKELEWMTAPEMPGRHENRRVHRDGRYHRDDMKAPGPVGHPEP
jgi:hypothetical protein